MIYVNTNELYHHGIKGQKWGVRRFQNDDGTLTPAGKRRRIREISKERSKLRNNIIDQIYSDDTKVGKFYKNANDSTDVVHARICEYSGKKAYKTIRSKYGDKTYQDLMKYDRDSTARKGLAAVGIMGVVLAATAYATMKDW